MSHLRCFNLESLCAFRTNKKRRTDNEYRCGVRSRDFSAVTSAAAAKGNCEDAEQKERSSRRLRDRHDDELAANFSTGESC